MHVAPFKLQLCKLCHFVISEPSCPGIRWILDREYGMDTSDWVAKVNISFDGCLSLCLKVSQCKAVYHQPTSFPNCVLLKKTRLQCRTSEHLYSAADYRYGEPYCQGQWLLLALWYHSLQTSIHVPHQYFIIMQAQETRTQDKSVRLLIRKKIVIENYSFHDISWDAFSFNVFTTMYLQFASRS